jgi:hypothetical protein
MTTARDFDKKCAVCTKTSPQTVLMSTSSWGYPDLDLRPSEMQRSSMFAWLQECPHCGYVSVDIEKELEASSDLLKSDEYLACDGYEFKSDLAKRFYRHYLISKAEKDYGSEFLSLLHCAWACDDADDDLAVEMRKLALESIGKIKPQSDDERNHLKFIKADLLRRSMQFDKLISEFRDVVFDDKLKNDAIDFQLELAAKKDGSCYTFEDIPKQVTIRVEGELLKKLNLISHMMNVSLVEVIETMLKEKADETDPAELMDKLMGVKK